MKRSITISVSELAMLGTLLSREYGTALLRLLLVYDDISASEAAARLNLHIKTAQDALESLASLGVAERQEVTDGKRPHFRYRLGAGHVRTDLAIEDMAAPIPGEISMQSHVRERRHAGAQFVMAAGESRIASLSVWTGERRSRKERRIALTTAQGRFLYHLPFPTAAPMRVSDIMTAAGVSSGRLPEILDMLGLLVELDVVETL
jgi:hypothetical protein